MGTAPRILHIQTGFQFFVFEQFSLNLHTFLWPPLENEIFVQYTIFEQVFIPPYLHTYIVCDLRLNDF